MYIDNYLRIWEKSSPLKVDHAEDWSSAERQEIDGEVIAGTVIVIVIDIKISYFSPDFDQQN